MAPDPKSSAGISENPQGSVSDADLIRRFDVSKKSVEQVAEKEALENGVIDIVVKLKRESPELDLSRLTPEELLGKFAQSKIQWSSAEQIAIEKVEELMGTWKYKTAKHDPTGYVMNEIRQKFLPRVEEKLKVAAAPLKVLKGQVDQKTAEAPEAPIVTPATAPLAEARAEVERKRLASQVGSPEKKGFEALPENLRQEAEFIRSVAMLEIVPGLAKEGAGKSELSTLSNLPYLLDDFPKYTPSASAKRAIRQLQAIIENPDKDNFSRAVAKEWETFSREGYQAAEIAFGNDFKKEGVTDSATRFAKRSFQKHPILSSAAVIAGAYGAYKLFSWIFGKKEEAEKKSGEKTEKKEGSFWGKAISYTIGGGALFLMGRYFWDDIKKFFEKGEQVKEVADKAGNLDILGTTLSALELAGVKFENLDPRPQDRQTAELINGLLTHQPEGDKLQNISSNAVSAYRKMKLGAVSSVLGKISDKSVLLNNLGDNKEYAGGFLKAIIANPALGEEIYTFHRLAHSVQDRHILKDDINDDMTVEQVSELLIKNQESIKADFNKNARAKGEGKTKAEKAADAVQGAAKETWAMTHEFLDAVGKRYGTLKRASDGKTLAEIIEGHKTVLEKKDIGLLDRGNEYFDIAKNVVEMLKENGKAVALIGAELVVIDGGTIVLKQSCAALYESFVALAWDWDAKGAVSAYWTHAGPLVAFGILGGTAKGAIKSMLGLGTKQGIVFEAFEGGLKMGMLPLKLGKAATVDAYYTLKHFREYSRIVGEEARLAKEWAITTAKKAIPFTDQTVMEEAYRMKRLHLLNRKMAYLEEMKNTKTFKTPWLEAKAIEHEIKDLIERIEDMSPRLKGDIAETIKEISEKIKDFSAAKRITDRPRLLKALAENDELKDLFLPGKKEIFRKELLGEEFMAKVDSLIKQGAKLDSEEFAKQLHSEIGRYLPSEAAKAASEGVKTAEGAKVASPTERATEFGTRFDELKGKIKTQNELIRSQAEARKMTVADFLSKDPQGAELARQLGNLEAEAGQAKELSRALGNVNSKYGKLLASQPELLAQLGENSPAARQLLREFLSLDKGLVGSLDKAKPGEVIGLLERQVNLADAILEQGKRVESAANGFAAAAKKANMPWAKFLETDAAKPLMETMGEADQGLNYLQRTQQVLRSQSSPFGKLLRDNSELLSKVMEDTNIRSQFFALDKRVIGHMAKNAGDSQEFAQALLSGDEAQFNGILEKIGSKLGIRNVLKAQAARVKSGMSYALDTVQGLPSSAKKLFRGSKESISQGWDKLIENFNKTEGFKVELETLNSLAGNKNAAEIVEILKKQGLPTEKIEAKVLEEAAQRIAKAEDAGSVAREIQELAKAAKVEALFSPKISRALWALRGLGKGLGYAGAGLGLGFGLYETGSSFYEAATTDVEGRRGILLEKGALYGLVSAADAAALFGLSAALPKVGFWAGATTVGGVGVSAAGAVTFALIPIAYMGTSAIESKLEATKTANEWASVDPTLLRHEWMTTTEDSISAGDQYRIFSSRKTIDEEHRKTREKIVEAILLQEDGEVNPDRLEFIKTRYKSAGYEKYDMNQQILTESRIYANMMANRRMVKDGGGTELLVGNLDLMEERFEKPGAAEMGFMIDGYGLNAIRAMDKQWKENFDRLSTGSLVDLAYQLRNKAEKAEGGIPEAQVKFLVDVENYLVLKRNVNLGHERALRVQKKMEEVSSEKLAELLDRFDVTLSKSDMEKEVAKLTDTPACYAIYKLAEFFGYSGHQEIEELKSFFSETNKNATAIYWDGGKWFINEAGREFDDEIGPELNETAIRTMVSTFNEEPDNIFGHRQESMVDWRGPIVDLSNQARRCGMILEKALKDYPDLDKPKESSEKVA